MIRRADDLFSVYSDMYPLIGFVAEYLLDFFQRGFSRGFICIIDIVTGLNFFTVVDSAK